MDWYSRKVLSWRSSISMDSAFCLDALNEAIQTYGAPDIFNTDQGSQFTSEEFTSALKSSNIKISMDGKGRWMDNVFIERLWRSLKYEEVYLEAYETVPEARAGIKEWIRFYNHERTHQSLGRQTDDEIDSLPRIMWEIHVHFFSFTGIFFHDANEFDLNKHSILFHDSSLS